MWEWEVYDQLSLTIASLCTPTADLFSWSYHAQRFCIRNPQVIASFVGLLLQKSTVENLPKCKLISVFYGCNFPEMSKSICS